MITFKVLGTEIVGQLKREKFTVPGDPETESILNSLAILHPVVLTGSPDPEYEFFEHILGHWPFLELLTRDAPPPPVPGRLY